MSVGSATRLRSEGLTLLPQFCFGSLRLTSMDEHAGVEWVVARARAGSPAVVVTSHIHHVRMASNDAAFRVVVERSELNLADGWPLVAASRLLRPRLPGRVIGIDLVDRVLGAGQRFNLAILGGPPGRRGRIGRPRARPPQHRSGRAPPDGHLGGSARAR